MRCAAVLAAIAIGCGGGATYLGAPLPPTCAHSIGLCELDLQMRGAIDVFPPPDEALRAYAERVADRVARVSSLARTPPIVLLPEGSIGVVGTSISLARDGLVLLGSEAELAGVIAHEIAHLETGLSDLYSKVDIDDETMRVLEGAADERATLLLSRAGYPPAALARALAAIVNAPDARHPRREVRLRRLSLIADPNVPGDEGRARYLAALAGVPIGPDLERRVGEAFVFVHAGLTVPLPAGVKRDGDGWRPLRGNDARTGLYYVTYSTGARSGDALIARLRDRHARRVAAGEVVVGRAPADVQPGLSSRDRLLEAQLRALWGLPAHSAVAVVRREHEAVLLIVSGDDPVPAVEAWAKLVRAPTDAERVATIPARIVLVPAPRAGTVADLVSVCVDPNAARKLDDPHRALAAGELFKCTDRVSAYVAPSE